MQSGVRVLDLGSGKGAAARHLAEKYGCHVTCFNLGRNQNAHCLMEARAAGIEHLVDAVEGNFNNGLPAEWTASFDVVWSQEALCHAKNQRAVLAEVMRVLKPGGVVIFTDIMRPVRSAQYSAFAIMLPSVFYGEVEVRMAQILRDLRTSRSQGHGARVVALT